MFPQLSDGGWVAQIFLGLLAFSVLVYKWYREPVALRRSRKIWQAHIPGQSGATAFDLHRGDTSPRLRLLLRLTGGRRPAPG